MIVVTGAAKGIGEVTAAAYATRGVKVVLADVDELNTPAHIEPSFR
ncbi:SDR family NAD(P)-dependent oxidoreductase [Paenibacillus sp. GCM10027626]